VSKIEPETMNRFWEEGGTYNVDERRARGRGIEGEWGNRERREREILQWRLGTVAPGGPVQV
jgi:hypothetical protein